MRDLHDPPRTGIRPLDREEIERRVRRAIEALLALHGDGSGPVPISAAELVRLAAPLTSRN